MKVRCKFQVQEIKKTHWQRDCETVILVAVGGGTPENDSFSNSTPSGRLEIYVSNPAVVGNIPLGAYYYLDLIPCE